LNPVLKAISLRDKSVLIISRFAFSNLSWIRYCCKETPVSGQGYKSYYKKPIEREIS
jgi:hypothetical protein